MSAIAVCSGKGSPGTTFVAVNLAAASARAGEQVLLLDLDPAGGDLCYLGLDPRRAYTRCSGWRGGSPEAPAFSPRRRSRGVRGRKRPSRTVGSRFAGHSLLARWTPRSHRAGRSSPTSDGSARRTRLSPRAQDSCCSWSRPTCLRCSERSGARQLEAAGTARERIAAAVFRPRAAEACRSGRGRGRPPATVLGSDPPGPPGRPEGADVPGPGRVRGDSEGPSMPLTAAVGSSSPTSSAGRGGNTNSEASA